MAGSDYLKIAVAYVGTQGQALRPLEVRRGTSVQAAIEQSGILAQFPEIDLKVNRVGIFGKLVSLDQAVDEGDRIEIYRPLIADPKTVRKRRNP